MRTIETLGGPFLCIERRWAHLWQGIDGSSIGALVTDYERTGEIEGWLGDIAVGDRHIGLIFNMPLFTGIWADRLGRPVVVRVKYIPHFQDEEPLLRSFEPLDSGDPMASRQVTFGSPDVVIFDPVYPGTEIGPDFLSLEIEPGMYRVDVVRAVIEGTASFIIHPFTRIYV